MKYLMPLVLQKISKENRTVSSWNEFHKFTLNGENSLTKLRPILRSATTGVNFVEYKRFNASMDSNLAKH